MTSKVTSVMTSKLFLESEIGYDRAFEIRIRDINEREFKQRSFSLFVKRGDKSYIGLEDFKNKIENLIKNSF